MLDVRTRRRAEARTTPLAETAGYCFYPLLKLNAVPDPETPLKEFR